MTSKFVKPAGNLIALALLLTAEHITVSADTCEPSGSPSVITDKREYEPGEIVVIHGEGFDCGVDLTISVAWPPEDGRVDTAFVTSNNLGEFTYSYELGINAISGAYTIEVRDASGNLLASTVFYDTHFRFGHITWAQVSGTTVEFEITLGFRRSFPFGCQNANVGDVCSFAISGWLNFGDGEFVTPDYTIIAVDVDDDWLMGTATIQHTYPDGGPYTAFNASCCRISPPRHINNPDLAWRVETVVDLTGSNSGSPVSLLPPIVDCPQNALCEFQIIATDPDDQLLQFSLTSPDISWGSASLDHPGPPDAPNAASIATDTCFGFQCGTYTWDATGATLNPDGETLYSTQVTIEEADGVKSAIDFFIRLVEPTPAPAGNQIKIPVRWCGMEDAASMVDPNLVGEATDQEVLLRRHERGSDNIYIPQANIAFRPGTVAELPDFPVIPDPDPVNTPDGTILDPDFDGGTEWLRAINRCRAAWQSAPQVSGVVAIHLNYFVDTSNDHTGTGGIALLPNISNTTSQMLFGVATVVDNFYRLRGELLGDQEEIIGDGVGDDDGICEAGEACQPVGDDDYFCELGEACQDGTETPGDLIELLGDEEEIIGDGVGNDDGVCDAGEDCQTVGDDDGVCDAGETCEPIGDDDGICEAGEACRNGDSLDTLLGHELGHALTLWHGNGFDNDGDGVLDGPPHLYEGDPLPGPNLMQYLANGSLITPAQRDQARDQALQHIPDIEVDPVVPPLAGSGVDLLGDVPPGEEFLDIDVIAASVDQITEVSRFGMSTAGLLPDDVSGLSFDFLVDADNNPLTGGDPNSIPGIPTTSAQGIELVGQVEVEVVGGVPQATPSVYSFDGAQFVEVKDPSIQASVHRHSLHFSVFDGAEPPPMPVAESIQLEMSNSLRGPLATDFKMRLISQNSNTGTLDDAEALITFRLPEYPGCTVNPGSAVLGASVTADATGLPPNRTAVVRLGLEEIASGPIDGSGRARISFQIPGETRTGFRLVTLGAPSTAMSATCGVFLQAVPKFDVPPTPPIGATLTVAAGDTLSFDVQASDRDPDDVVSLNVIGTPLAFGATFASTPSNPASGTFSWTPTVDQAGSYVIVFTATDNTGLSAPLHSVTVEVQAVINQPPTATAGDDQTVKCAAPQRADATLNGTSSTDPDGDALAFSWSAPGIVFDDPTSLTPNASFPLGTTTVTLVVNDGLVDSAPDTVDISVQDTTPPTLSAQWVPLQVEEDEGKFILQFGATDVCDPAPQVTGIVETPNLDGLDIELKTKSKVEIEFDLEEGKVKIKGPDPEALLAQLQEFGGFLVDSGQLVKIELEEANEGELEFKFEKDGTLKIEAPSATLKVTGKDATSNTTSMRVSPQFAAEKDDHDGHEDDPKDNDEDDG